MNTNAVRRFAFGGAVRAPSWIRSWRTMFVVGRALLSLIFILSGIAKIFTWGSTVDMMSAVGIPEAPLFLALAIAVEVLGGLSILTGTLARLGAVVLLVYLIPVTVVFHAFWNLSAMEQQVQMINFLKNLSIMGGLLVVAAVGAGAISVDSMWKKARAPVEGGASALGEASEAPAQPG